MESKRLWVESIQKDITETCFNDCFDTTEFNVEGNCLKSCYGKYKEVLNITNRKLEELGYNCES
jgi:Tim10/DDP family zinc finger